VVAAAAAMTTDPDSSERLVALRSNRPTQPFPHAQATKIVTAGISVSAVFGIVAYLGHSAEVQSVAKSRALERLAVSQAAAGELYRPPATVAPTTVPSIAPTTAGPTVLRPGDVAVSPASVPQVVVAVPVPAPVPVVPAPRPASQNNQSAQGGQGVATPAPSNTTKSSG
jgi:hypothetical protein